MNKIHNSSQKYILSIDPGYDKCGYALFDFDNYTLRTSGLIKTNPHEHILVRFNFLVDRLTQILTQYTVAQMVMEDVFFFKNAKTVVKVAQSQGVIIALAVQSCIPLEILTPLQIKQSVTGDGRADKQAVWKMLQLEIGDQLQHVSDDDESDAIAIGYAYIVRSRHNNQIVSY